MTTTKLPDLGSLSAPRTKAEFSRMLDLAIACGEYLNAVLDDIQAARLLAQVSNTGPATPH